MNPHQLRPWFLASVAVAILLLVLTTHVDKQHIYQQIQSQLQQSDIALASKHIALSTMYIGSIRLDHVHIQTQLFELHAKHLFIDLNLAALLTGKAVPQAIYLQSADINIIQDKQEPWLRWIQHKTFKIKRINITQSEVHLESQHLTLEQTDLDIRDIGINKNPRMELQAHIGEGQIDAHGYIRLKHGKVSRGFGRIRLNQIPIDNWQHHTTLKTLSGSMTSHINQDGTWQSFGHLTLQESPKNTVEIRGKVVGGQSDYFLSIQNMVVRHKPTGTLQISGDCITQQQCAFTIQSSSLTLQPLFHLLQLPITTNGQLHNTKMRLNLNNHHWVSYIHTQWDAFSLTPNLAQPTAKPIQIPPATLNISDFDWSSTSTWNMNKLVIISNKKKEIEISQATYRQQTLTLPMKLYQTSFWLPISQWLWQESHIQGDGQLDGFIDLTFKNAFLIKARMNLDATQTQFQSSSMYKPQHVPLHIQGELVWEEDKLPTLATISLALADSSFTLKQQGTYWYFHDLDVDFDQVKEAGIQLPPMWQHWHGYIHGSTTLHIPDDTITIKQANIDLIQFGKGKHYVDGQIITNGNTWEIENLRWEQGKNMAYFFSRANNRFDIEAVSLDTQAFTLLQNLPFQPSGHIQINTLRLPFGTLNQVHANYSTHEKQTFLQAFQGKFYEGTLKAGKVAVLSDHNQITIKGRIQVGGVHLNNWRWLHKQLETHLEGTVYATLNLEATLNHEQALKSWQADGEIAVYNGLWLLNDKNIKADKLVANIRKRKAFHAILKVKDGKHQGSGHLNIDAQNKVSGKIHWQGKTYQLTKSWPKLRYLKKNTSP